MTRNIAGARTIGVAARESGVSAKMIRHYESLGLFAPAARSGGNYRLFTEDDMHTLRFIHRARGLGFSLEDISRLLDLWRDRERPSAEVKALAMRHVAVLREKVDGLVAMIDTLESLASRCHGDDRPDCPILDGLDGGDGDARHGTASAHERAGA
ncbi:MAG: Cu(I)-responsive transcriptional regulator [Burkholderiaceae bacterium]